MTIARRIHNFLHPKLGCIVMLHRVSENSNNKEPQATKSLTITPAAFEELINGYRQKGWQFASMDDVVGKIPLRSTFGAHNSQSTPFVSLTFDDGFLDTYTMVYPLLKQLQVPFCVYMARDFYRGTARPQWDRDAKMMNIEHLLEMSRDPLCTIGAHTCSHPRLSGLSAEGQRMEMSVSKDDLEQLLGKEVRHMAYPHGDYTQTTVDIATELGFKTAVTTSGRFVRNDSRLMELDRLVTF